MRYLDIEAEVVEDEQDEMDEDATGEMGKQILSVSCALS